MVPASHHREYTRLYITQTMRQPVPGFYDSVIYVFHYFMIIAGRPQPPTESRCIGNRSGEYKPGEISCVQSITHHRQKPACALRSKYDHHVR